MEITAWKWIDERFQDIFYPLATRIDGELGDLMSPWGNWDAIFPLISYWCPLPWPDMPENPVKSGKLINCPVKGFVEYGHTKHNIDGIFKTTLQLLARFFPDYNNPVPHAFTEMFSKRKKHMKNARGLDNSRLTLKDDLNLYPMMATFRALLLMCPAPIIGMVGLLVQR